MAGKVNRSWFWADVAGSLRAQPLRTVLTFTSVAIGMLALCMLLSILAGLNERARRQISDIGADVIAVASTRSGAIDTAVLQRLRGLVPDASCAGLRRFVLNDVIESGPVQIFAVDIELPAIRGWKLAAGRWLDANDVATSAPHALISATLAEQRFLQPGDTLALRDTVVRIVGIMRDDGERFVITTRSLPAWWITEPPGAMFYDAIYVKTDGATELASVAGRIRRDLSGEQNGTEDTWVITTPATLVASTKRMIRTVQLVYGSVAALCLVLGGVTLFSLMMVSVQQRIGEIGLRMAIGASWRDIFLMFLCEGLVTTIVAAVAGVAGGAVLLHAMGDAIELPVVFSTHVVMVPLMSAAALGLLFSWYPAHTAASITPADALRHD